MKSFQTLYTLFTSLSQNTSSDNSTLGKQLINDAHRYLLQKYYNNETTYSIATYGGADSTLTGTLASGAVSATLNTAWTGNTTKIQVTFSNDDIRMVNFVTGSTALTWDVGLTATATASIEIGAEQFYPLPPNYSKLKDLTITVGDLKWTPKEVLTRREWDELNVFPYYSDIPVNFYIYPGGDHGAQVGIWPIPSTTNNIITFAYKFRVPDLSLDDYTTPGTVSVTSKSTAVTGSGTSFIPTTNIQNEARWIQFPYNKGDNLWYQVVSINSATSATLYQPYQGITVSGASASGGYTIGEMPLLNEDFHDLLVYRPLFIYFSSINPDPKKADRFKGLYDEGVALLAEYSGSNTVDVNLGRRTSMMNPNLFSQSFGDTP